MNTLGREPYQLQGAHQQRSTDEDRFAVKTVFQFLFRRNQNRGGEGRWGLYSSGHAQTLDQLRSSPPVTIRFPSKGREHFSAAICYPVIGLGGPRLSMAQSDPWCPRYDELICKNYDILWIVRS